jgi:hypothetical protein
VLKLPMLEAESAGVNEDVEDTVKAIAISGSQRNRYKSGDSEV